MGGGDHAGGGSSAHLGGRADKGAGAEAGGGGVHGALLASVRADGWDEDEIAHHFAGWNDKFGRFLADEEVATQLLQPFAGDEPEARLNAETMRRGWQAADLPFADELNVAGINRRYVRELNGKRLRKAEWRALLQGQLDLEQLTVVRGIRGVWPDFDLAKYTARFRERYQRLDLSAMSRAEEEQLDTRLLLGCVFVPPDAREAVPVRELPREYRSPERTGDEKAAATALANVWNTASRGRLGKFSAMRRAAGWCCWAIPVPARR